jgi:hypothetical protein
VTIAARVVLVGFAAGVLAASALAAPASRRHAVAFVTLSGKGSVVSAPRGIRCPAACRGLFLEGERVQLVARPAPGWRLARLATCGNATSCRVTLPINQDCAARVCHVGAFGFRVTFVRERGVAS